MHVYYHRLHASMSIASDLSFQSQRLQSSLDVKSHKSYNTAMRIQLFVLLNENLLNEKSVVSLTTINWLNVTFCLN